MRHLIKCTIRTFFIHKIPSHDMCILDNGTKSNKTHKLTRSYSPSAYLVLISNVVPFRCCFSGFLAQTGISCFLPVHTLLILLHKSHLMENVLPSPFLFSRTMLCRNKGVASQCLHFFSCWPKKFISTILLFQLQSLHATPQQSFVFS